MGLKGRNPLFRSCRRAGRELCFRFLARRLRALPSALAFTAPRRLSLLVASLVVAVAGAPLGGCSRLQRDPYDTSPGVLNRIGGTNVKREFKKMVGKGPNQEVARKHFKVGNEMFEEARNEPDRAQRRRRFADAAKQYADAAERWPDSALEEDAFFMQGESLFFADHYDAASNAYGKLLKKHSNSRHLDKAQARRFAIARYWDERTGESSESVFYFNINDDEFPLRDTQGHALRVYDNIRLDDPTGKLADDATMAAGVAQFRKGRFIAAEEYFRDLRETFPDSEHQFMAHFLGVKAKLSSYQGVDYAGHMLNEAEDLIRRIRVNFPHEAEEKAEYLDRALAEVRMSKAERTWFDGSYYDRRKEYAAARFHYQNLIREYEGTPLADRARERLENLHGLPDTPPERLGWLVSLFPKSNEEPPLLASPLLEAGAPAVAAAGSPESASSNGSLR